MIEFIYGTKLMEPQMKKKESEATIMTTLHDLKEALSQNSEIKNALESVEYERSRIVAKKRMELGMSQIEFAKRAQVTLKTIRRVEGADQGIEESAVKKIYTALKINNGRFV